MMVGVSVDVGLAEGGASLGSLPCWIYVPVGGVSCPSVKGNVSSSGCGEPGGGVGKGVGSVPVEIRTGYEGRVRCLSYVVKAIG